MKVHDDEEQLGYPTGQQIAVKSRIDNHSITQIKKIIKKTLPES